MTTFTVGQENSTAIELYYEDHGSGQPVVLVAGWPLSGASWEKQTFALLAAGYRVVTYDRRGFGGSSKVATGYDYDTLAADLDALMTRLDLQDAVLVGFSMGTGEVVRYLATHGSSRVSKAVLIESVPPFLLKTEDNPDGVDKSVFDGIMDAIIADRPTYLTGYFEAFYNTDVLMGTRIMESAVQVSFIDAAGASGPGTYNCVSSWLEDFRDDVQKVDVPVLVIHGVEDRILPIDVTGRKVAEGLPDARLIEIEGGPHCVIWTHGDEVNRELVAFLAGVPAAAAAGGA